MEVGRWWNTLLWTGTEGQDDDVAQAKVVPDTVRGEGPVLSTYTVW